MNNIVEDRRKTGSRICSAGILAAIIFLLLGWELAAEVLLSVVALALLYLIGEGVGSSLERESNGFEVEEYSFYFDRAGERANDEVDPDVPDRIEFKLKPSGRTYIAILTENDK